MYSDTVKHTVLARTAYFCGELSTHHQLHWTYWTAEGSIQTHHQLHWTYWTAEGSIQTYHQPISTITQNVYLHLCLHLLSRTSLMDDNNLLQAAWHLLAVLWKLYYLKTRSQRLCTPSDLYNIALMMYARRRDSTHKTRRFFKQHVLAGLASPLVPAYIL